MHRFIAQLLNSCLTATWSIIHCLFLSLVFTLLHFLFEQTSVLFHCWWSLPDLILSHPATSCITHYNYFTTAIFVRRIHTWFAPLLIKRTWRTFFVFRSIFIECRLKTMVEPAVVNLLCYFNKSTHWRHILQKMHILSFSSLCRPLTVAQRAQLHCVTLGQRWNGSCQVRSIVALAPSLLFVHLAFFVILGSHPLFRSSEFMAVA